MKQRSWRCALAAAVALVLPGAGFAGEAPELAAAVKAGQLPPLEQRLSKNPKVVPVIEKIGSYGGVWRSSMVGGNDRIWIMRVNSHETLVSWKRDWNGEVEANVAASWTVDAAATTYDFKLRDGMKWSDGQPFTADDLGFFYNDVARNKGLIEPGNSQIWTEDNAPVFKKISDTEFSFTFAKPYALFLQRLSGPAGAQLFIYPKHYCGQFHIAINANAEADARRAGIHNWQDMFKNRCTTNWVNSERYSNPANPVLNAWKIERPLTGGTKSISFVRNPYYWKVDPAGNQLPYIDGLDIAISAEAQSVVLRALNGEIDMQDRNINATSNRAIFAQGRERGRFRMVNESTGGANTLMISLNLSHRDPRMRAILGSKPFRTALSYGIDRQAIIDAVYLGIGEPAQVAPLQGTPYYDEAMTRQYTEYDPSRAGKILDENGFKRGADGFRADAAGKRVTFVCDVTNANPEMVSAMELVTKYWQALGVDARMNVADRVATIERTNRNESDCTPWFDVEGGPDLLLEPRAFVPVSMIAYFGVGWFQWYTKGPYAVEPPDAIKQSLLVYKQIESAADPAEQRALMQKVIATARDEFLTIGISTPPPAYIIVSNRLRNVQDPTFWGWNFFTPAATGVEQFFFAK